jgi:hypothetical protein
MYACDILRSPIVIIWEEEKEVYFMQNGTTAHTANYSIHVLNKAFEDRLISRRLWPARSPDLNPFDLYLWGNLRNKVVQIISAFWINFSTTFVKYLHLSRSVYSDEYLSLQET